MTNYVSTSISLLEKRKNELETELNSISNAIAGLKNINRSNHIVRDSKESREVKYTVLEKFINNIDGYISIADLIKEFVDNRQAYKNRFALNAALHDLKKRGRITHVNTGIYSAKKPKSRTYSVSGKRSVLLLFIQSKRKINLDELTKRFVGIDKVFKSANALQCAIYDLRKAGKIKNIRHKEYEPIENEKN